MQRLADVYDNNLHRVGEFETRYNREFTLMPIAHVSQNVQLEVILKEDATFHRARVIPKEESSTIIPATLDSANRSGSKIAPHYVHDKLFYVAKDYKKFGSNRKRDENFDAYETQMLDWAEQPNAPEKVKVITSYIQKGTLIQDLIEAGIIYLDTEGQVIEKWTSQDDKKYGIEKPPLYKETTGTVFDATVRFDVLNEVSNATSFWRDPALFENFIAYIRDRMMNDRKLIKSDPESFDKGICYVTGEEGLLTTQHGSKLRHAGDMSKIISSNDSSGYTYRGRFKEPTEAAQIGYDISQKSHQALRWLVQRQGTNVDTRYFVTFGHIVPETLNTFAGSFDLIGASSSATEAVTEELASKEITKAIHGLANHIEGFYDNRLITMALDAATSGRLAIVYYQETDPKLFLDALTHWYTHCRWMLFYRDENKKVKTAIGTPSTFDLAKAIYGDKTNPAVKKEFYTRILPSILERRPIPKDMIRRIYQRVIRPESFKGTMESWDQTLHIACAMISYNYKEEVPDMTLQKENMNRDYLFGRLLGVAEVMERRILNERDKQGKDSRSTNAMRYFTAFSNRPARTWLVIRKQLQPYFDRLYAQSIITATMYSKLIQEIEDAIGPEGMTDIALQPIFLTGYSSQVQEMYKKKEEKDEEHDTTK